MSKIRYIDLFAGAGGMSEGFKRAGYQPVAHIEMDAAACLTLETRVAYHYLKEQGQIEQYYSYLTGKISRAELLQLIPHDELATVLHERLAMDTLGTTFRKIDEVLDGHKVDLVIGGPPCQVYSLVGRSRMGMDKAKNDVRYFLYQEYGEILKRYQPKMFVFENVQGLLSIENGNLLKDIREYLLQCGYRTEFRVLHASEYGVMQRRKRVIIIGKRGNSKFDFPEPDIQSMKGHKLKETLFSDLPALSQGEEPILSQYTTPTANTYLADSGIRNGIPFVTQHITRPHNTRDLKIYKIAVDKWINHRERLKYPDLPEDLKTHSNQSSFLDRYKVMDPEGLSHTVVAHLSKDGHYFIYPDPKNVRSASVREVARIQSFSDDFYFEGGRSAAFKQIGNAVPPMMAYYIANKIQKNL